MPLTKADDSAVPKRLAISMASLIATLAGTSSDVLQLAQRQPEEVAIDARHALEAPVRRGAPAISASSSAQVLAHAAHQRLGERAARVVDDRAAAAPLGARRGGEVAPEQRDRLVARQLLHVELIQNL